jgi:putative tricarboxylic transport membrane protein
MQPSTPDSEPEERSLVGNRTMDVIMALLLLGVSAIVIYDSVRLGFGWIEGEGPAPGYFPFYVALALAAASLVTLVQALAGTTEGAGESFVGRTSFLRVLAVLIPSLGYVALIEYLGLYIASAIFIALFMLVIGRDKIIKSILVGLAVPAALYLMFEKWFLVPLPKGPLDIWLPKLWTLMGL